MQTLLRYLIAGLFLFTGTFHFLKPEYFVKIVPPGLPWPLGLVYLSGALEIAGGVGLLLPQYRKAAAYGLVALLVAVFPANIYMAMAPVKFGGIFNYPLYHWIRLPLQFALIYLLLKIA